MNSFLTLGFLLGIRHAMEADHIATVASLASVHSNRWQVMKQGLAWGVGHSLMLLLVGGVVLLSGVHIPEWLSSGMEMVVGALMVVLGVDVVRRVWRERLHFHPHSHGEGEAHYHFHSHAVAPPSAVFLPGRGPVAHHHSHSHIFPIRALGMGLVHGMAGSAALVLLFIDQAGSIASGLLYIALFGIGSILGMMLFSIVLSVPLGLTAARFGRVHHSLQMGIGVVTSLVGALLMTGS